MPAYTLADIPVGADVDLNAVFGAHANDVLHEADMSMAYCGGSHTDPPHRWYLAAKSWTGEDNYAVRFKCRNCEAVLNMGTQPPADDAIRSDV